MIPERTPGALAAHLSEALGEPCRIVGGRRMSMGQSRAMYVADLECERTGPRKVVVRVEQFGLLGGNSRDEAAAMRAARKAGQPVAEILSFEQSHDILGQPFFVMEFVPGSSVFAQASLDPYIESLKALHAADVAAMDLPDFPMPVEPNDAALIQVERWYDVYRGAMQGEPSPLIEEAAQWLRNNAPETERVSLVHGDPGPGNYLHVDGALSAVVDWEFAHFGDAEEDWAYLICMRGMGVMPQTEWVEYLASRHGIVLDPVRLDYWIALNLFKAACIDQTALEVFMSGRSKAPNLLAIATCVHVSALKRLAETVL